MHSQMRSLKRVKIVYYTSIDQVIYDLNKLLIFLSVIDKFENGKNHPMVSKERIDNLLDCLKEPNRSRLFGHGA